jgi:hypothetical protein
MEECLSSPILLHICIETLLQGSELSGYRSVNASERDYYIWARSIDGSGGDYVYYLFSNHIENRNICFSLLYFRPTSYNIRVIPRLEAPNTPNLHYFIVELEARPAEFVAPRSISQASRVIHLIFHAIHVLHVLPVLCINPPSTTISVPVIYDASLLARNKAALATSHAVPIFPIGTC